MNLFLFKMDDLVFKNVLFIYFFSEKSVVFKKYISVSRVLYKKYACA